jgi:hypothetical protein
VRSSRTLFLALVALACAATASVGAAAPAARSPLRWALLLVLPLLVGALATLLAPPPHSPRFPAAVPMPTFRHAPLLVALVLIDFAPLGVGALTGQVTFSAAAGELGAARLAALLVGLPAVVGAMTLGWEWGLRQRLYAPTAAAGAPATALLLSIGAGVALSLPAIAPGFVVPELPFALAALAGAALREATAVRLFRRAGILLSGAYRGALAGLEGLVIADWSSLWYPSVLYVSSDPAFYLLRAAGPFAALAVAALWCRRLDASDARRRRQP